MKVVFCKIKDSISSASQFQVFNTSSFGPNESEVEFGLQFPQLPPRKASNANRFYEFDTLMGKIKGISRVSEGARDPYEDEGYQGKLHNHGDIVVHKTFETRTISVDLNETHPNIQWSDVSYV
jgi:hypothetical protein